MGRPTTPLPPVIDIQADVVTDETTPTLAPEELADLRRARTLLTSPGPAIRFANLIGTPIEKGLQLLPAGASRLVQRASRAALKRALALAVHSLDPADDSAPDNRLHKMLVGASGAVGGAFGLGAIVLELPLSTTLILRSIAQIAASQGHDLRQLDTRLACLQVFALGGDTTADDASETSYWAVRAALARLVSEAASALAGRTVAAESSPAAVRLLTALAARFGIVVSEQVAAKAIPVVGAAAGAAINVVFMDHFQRIAEGHFIVCRLERRHGNDIVRRTYDGFGCTQTA
jgi:hypothetical protein